MVLPDGVVIDTEQGVPQGGVMTAPTQQVTWVIGACRGGDRVSDCDAVVADENFSVVVAAIELMITW